MALPARYCSQCGHQVVRRVEAGRQREVCPNCATVFYQNPLPVAAAAVLDDQRRLLLVKRALDPQKGKWCLPMGFAEVEETIREAALRELREEAGIEGEVRFLLDADSYPSRHHGDLLIMSFEVRKTGGREVPGDDAEDVAYFPLPSLPPLAFRSNERAVAALVARHRDEWRIKDSFARFRYGREETLLSDPLVLALEERSEEIGRFWVEQLIDHRTTTSFRGLALPALRADASGVLGLLTGRLRGRASSAQVATLFADLGARWCAQGLPLQEVMSSVSLLKLEVWRVARRSGVWEGVLDVYRVLELSFLVNSFFDRAVFHLSRSYAASLSAPLES